MKLVIKKELYIHIAELDFSNLEDIFKRYLIKGMIGIYSELDDHKYKNLQQKIKQIYFNDKQVKFVRCSYRAQNIKTEIEAVKQLALYHVKESLHSGI